MPERCAACGSDVLSNARFCPACGLAVGGRLTTEERRTVTVLFADLVGSTRLGEQFDPEVMRALVDRFFQLAAAEVRRHGGVVQAFSGDAAVGVFGLKAAHEDDAERAVRAALALQAAIDSAQQEWMGQPGVTFAARVGIESGEVVVGDPYGGSTMATGDCLNVAARLEQQAGPGQIVIGPAAFAATRRTARVEALGPVELAGKREPVHAWRVVSVAGDTGAPRGIEGLSAPLTGRDEEMALLQQAARRTVSERKAVLCTLVGAPGVGKSRLVRELTGRLEADGTRVLRGRCLPYGDGITYWPLSEMCQSFAQLTTSLSPTEAIQRLEAVTQSRAVAERLAFAMGITAESPVEGAGVDREISWAFRRALEVLGTDQPLALVFEDIHWAQPALLNLIEYLGDWLRGTPVMILCPTRPELLDRRPTWGGGRVEASRILLEPLSPKDSAALVEALLRAEALPNSLRDRILERSEGNPLFVEELLRMLIENGRLILRDGRWMATETSADVPVPDTVQAIIRARLDTLPQQERTLLQAAAVVGRVFERSALLALLESREVVEAQLDELVLRDLINEDPSAAEPTYRFKHILIRDVAYASVPKARRARWHERFAQSLTQVGSQRSEIGDIAAYHLETASLLERELQGQTNEALRSAAVEALASASERASAREDLGAALRFAQRALALEPAPEARRLEIQWLELEAVWRLGDFPRAGELGRHLMVAAQRLGRKDLEGRALVAQYERVAHTRGPVEATTVCERARELSRQAGDAVYEFEAALRFSQRGWWSGNLEQAYRDFAETRELARRLGDRGREVRTLVWLAGLCGMQLRVSEAKALIEEMLTLIERGASRLLRAQVVSTSATAIGATTSAREGLEMVLNNIPLLEELGDMRTLPEAMQVAAMLSRWIGDFEGSKQWYDRAIDFLHAIEHRGFLPEVERGIAETLLARNDLAGAVEHAERAVDMVLPEDTVTVASTRMVLGRVRGMQGRDQEGRDLLTESIQMIETTSFFVVMWEYYVSMAEFCLARGLAYEGEQWLARTLASIAPLGEQAPMLEEINRRIGLARAGRAASARETL